MLGSNVNPPSLKVKPPSLKVKVKGRQVKGEGAKVKGESVKRLSHGLNIQDSVVKETSERAEDMRILWTRGQAKGRR